ncbi:MAG: RNA methyltransferase [Bacteroidales bacterium]|nr:RNA methyltransferase [Bacteroidales bacterium]
MISSSKAKLIRSLRQKKYRDQHRLFLIEGEKMILELATAGSGNRFRIQEIMATPEWIENKAGLLPSLKNPFSIASFEEIKKVSNLVTPQAVIALVSIPESRFSAEVLLNGPVLALESIRDPGNLGTIIRTADWFGIDHIICTPDSTDLYNPKVIQSTMGAVTRVQVHYLELEPLLANPKLRSKRVYGTYLEGENIYRTRLEPDPLILFGNESRGLSGALSPYIQHRISIPSYASAGSGPESLNVASSVAVVCSELRRG